jgi:hypothetical protein
VLQQAEPSKSRQVKSRERQSRDTKTEIRLAHCEDKVFVDARHWLVHSVASCIARDHMITVAPATVDDLDYVMATERLAGYETLVGRWERELHEAASVDSHHAYLIARDGDYRIGFAILRGWASPERVTRLKRISVAALAAGMAKTFCALSSNACLRKPTPTAFGSACSRTMPVPAARTSRSVFALRASPAEAHSSATSFAMSSSWRSCGRTGRPRLLCHLHKSHSVIGQQLMSIHCVLFLVVSLGPG